MQDMFDINIRCTFDKIAKSIEKFDSIKYMDLEEFHREVKKAYLKGNIGYENYKEWDSWDRDIKEISLHRYVFFSCS